MFQKTVRKLMKWWVASGVKTGYVYWLIDKYPELYSSEKPIAAHLKNSLQMDCLLSDHVQARIYFFGAYEPIEVYLLGTLLSPDSVFIDVGANVGFYSLMLSQACKNGKVYSFEPVSENYKILKHHIDSNGLHNRIHPFQKGLWDSNTTLEFSLPDDGNHGGFTAGRNLDTDHKISCDVVTLDWFVAKENLSRVDVIKMDIEGAELFALRGAENTLRTFEPIIQIELNAKACEGFDYTLKELEAYLTKLNYTFYKVGHVAEQSNFIQNFDGISQVNVIAFPLSKKNKLNPNWDSREIVRSFL